MGKAIILKKELLECRKGFQDNFDSLRERMTAVLGEMNGKIDKIQECKEIYFELFNSVDWLIWNQEAQSIVK